MPVYVTVPEIRDCDGCAANHDVRVVSTSATKLCIKLSSSVGGCNTHKCIFIEDTEAARIAYITLKLEN